MADEIPNGSQTYKMTEWAEYAWADVVPTPAIMDAVRATAERELASMDRLVQDLVDFGVPLDWLKSRCHWEVDAPRFGDPGSLRRLAIRLDVADTHETGETE